MNSQTTNAELRVLELPEHEERRIRQYVDGQIRDPEDPVTLVQKVGQRRIVGQSYDLYDVHTEKSRWWVVTNITNLYSQDDFPQIDMAFTYHLGLCTVLAERSHREADDEPEGYAQQAWRRFKSAADSMDTAGEAEDFQAVGVMCRETLLALVREYSSSAWVADLGDAPKLADFKAWTDRFAEVLTEGRLRSYLKALADKTWDLCVWLQHYANATPWDAELVLDATAHFLGAFTRCVRRHEEGAPVRCSVCESYLLVDDGEADVEDGKHGYRHWTVCGGCGWRSESTFDVWDDIDPSPPTS